MRLYLLLAAFVCALSFGCRAANATVDIAVDLTNQRMDVTSPGGSYSWSISSGRAGYLTPTGVFRSQALYRMIRSKDYGNAPMPHAIFFTGGYAIHGTDATWALGRPASHGCIRLAPANAATLFEMVKAEGGTITITGVAPVPLVASASSHNRAARLASGSHAKSHRYAHASHGKGTRYAGGPGKKHHHLASRLTPAPAQSPPPVQDMMGFYGTGQ